MPASRVARLLILLCLMVPSAMAQGNSPAAPAIAEPDSDRDDPAARDQWFMQGRVAPKGTNAADLRWKAYQQKIQMRAARMVAARQAGAAGTTINAAAGTTWAPLGPAPLNSNNSSGFDFGSVSGRATSVAVDPADVTGNTVYLGGAYGGVWRSQNAGSLSPNPANVTWSPMSDTQPTLAVGAIALQPCSATLANCDNTKHLSKTILIGTGEPNSAIDSYYGLGILRSVDAGNTWTLISSANSGASSFKGLGFSKFAFDVTSGKENIVVAGVASTIGTSDGARASGQLSGPFVSSDSGLTWSAATSINDGTFGGSVAPISVTSVAFNAQAGANGTFYMAMRFHGFYSSTDFGSTWTRLATQPAPAATGINSSTTCPTAGSTSCPFFRGEISVVPGRNEMYVWYTDRNDADQGIWRSINGGSSWTQLDDTNIGTCGDPGGCGTKQAFYDLELAAVPNNNGPPSTDLYAGTRNLYKCTISGTVSNTTCSGSGTTSFQNLTHVYNCAGHNTVHPDQHGIGFQIVGATDVMYFANDGGINRALDGFTGLTTANCLSNQFDDLNGSLGSMTQFVSFSQDPANSAILLGGTQDNGSPTTSQTNTNWQVANFGDGGYNEIDPANPSNWYTANTDVSIFRCTAGSACSVSSFISVVDPGKVGSDSSAFYTPYILDPQNSGALLVGTCRIWRGASTGTGFVAISPNFDAGFATTCPDPNTSTTPVNFVHALAAGGPVGANGLSKVVYAGLAGFGPINVANPPGGRVFVTMDSSASSIAWSEITPPANQSTFYTIGAIAIDPADATGATAFVALQGFNTSHVVKTTNANLGINATWTDFSGTLPNAPANSLLIDSASNTIYVGTDVGVFVSATNSASWSEVGPAPVPNQPAGTGYLPEAPVTRLRLFNKNGTKLLRASTYGRGIWEFTLALGTPDFTPSVPTATLTAYPNQTVIYAGTLTAVNAYNSPVNLTCTGGKPAACAAGTTPITPTAGGAAFTINAAHGSAGDFAFFIHAAGTDSVPQVHDTAATLHVVDFTLGTLSPASITVNVPNSSLPVTIPITPSSNFADTITFSCTNAPANVSCSFSPNPVPSGTTSTTLTVTAGTGATSVANFALGISANANTNPAPTAKTKTLTLTVTAIPDYSLVVGGQTPPAVTVQGQPTYAGTITFVNGYNLTPTITCTAGTTAPPATCTATANPKTATGITFTVLAADTVANTYNFKIHTTDGTITHDTPVTLVLAPDFHIINNTTTQTVTAGGTATFTPLTFKPDGAATLVTATSFTCSGLPSLSTCTFSPASIPAGSAQTDVTLTIHTTAAVASGTSPSLPWKPSGPLYALWLSLPALGIVSIGSRLRSKKRLAVLGGLLVLALVGSFAACGGGSSHQGQPGTPPGSYTITVNATSAAPGIAKQSTTVKMVVQ